MSEAPERDGVYWGGNQHYVEEMEVVGQIGQCGRVEVPDNAIAWVLSGLGEYVDVRDVEYYSIPSAYSSWLEEMGDWFVGKTVEKDGETVTLAVPSTRLKAAHKSLTGGGHYDGDEYVLIDAAPVPVLKGPEGAVAIAPVEVQTE